MDRRDLLIRVILIAFGVIAIAVAALRETPRISKGTEVSRWWDIAMGVLAILIGAFVLRNRKR